MEDSKYTNIENLLEFIKDEKQKLVKEKKIKKIKPLPAVDEDEALFKIPKHWKWVRFEEITINRDGERIPVSQRDRENRGKTYDYYGASGVIDKIDNYIFDKSLLLIGEDGANLLSRSKPIAFIAKGKYWVNNHAHVIDSVDMIILRYLEWYMNFIDLSPYVTGSAQPKLTQAKLNSIPVALPPLAEQERIVNRIESLFDKVDKAAGLVDEARDGFEKRRAAILSNAVRGNLTKEYRGSTNQSMTPDNLLKLVLDKKDELIKAKKIKKEKRISDTEENEVLFEIPNSWKWVRIKDITINRDGERVPVSQSDRSNREKIYDYYGASGVIDKIDDYIFDKELLLIGEDGANLVTRSKPIAFMAKGKYWVNNHAHILDSIDLDILKYIEIYINSIDLGPYISGSAQPKLTQAKLNNILVPLPSLEEQKQIVKTVNELLEKESGIEDVTNIDLLVGNIKKSILAKAFRGELGSNDLNEESCIEVLKIDK